MFAGVEGTESIQARPQAFIDAFARRVESGLLRGAMPRRTQYAVTRKSADGLAFRAAGWLTAITVGLNDVDLSVSPPGRAQFTIRYLRWAAFVLASGVAFAVIFSAALLAIDIRSYIAQHAASRVPGLSLDQDVALAWGMGLFWGLVWPWILILLHRQPLRRLMRRLIVEVDAEARAA
jgi:hypothetical protein